MRIVSWNVNGIRACAQKGFASFVSNENPDLILIQESKAKKEQCPEVLESLSSYSSAWHSAQKPGYSGVANFFLSSAEGRVEMGMRMPIVDDEGRILIQEFPDFQVINAYVPNGAASDERHHFKMNFLERFLSFLVKRDKQKPLILAGDINIAHREIDIHDPVRLNGTSGFKPEERAWMDELFSQGFVDVFRHFNPEAEARYSWWSYRALSRQRNKGWRIDYFIASKSILPRIRSMEMLDQVKGSDHCPLVLEILN